MFLINERIISSENKTTLRDDSFNVYKLDNFLYLLDKEQIKGNNIIAISNFDLPKSDKYYFKNGIIDLKNPKFCC